MGLETQTQEFIFLLTRNQRKIYTYVLSAVGRRSIADEIMQRTLLVMWRKFSQFEEGTNFSAWGKSIAKYEILNLYRTKHKTDFLDPKSLEMVMQVSQRLEKKSDQRIKALEGCLKKLKVNRRQLVDYRYNQGLSCGEIAEKMNCPITTIYKTIARIHSSLQDCIHRTLRLWEVEA